MGAGVAGNTLEFAGGIDQFRDLLVRSVQLLEVRALLERLLDGHRAERGRHRGHEARDSIYIRVAHSERPPDISNRSFSPEGAKRNYLGHAVLPVFLGGVADHLVPAVFGEVQVYVRHLSSFDVEESFEDQPVFQRVDVGYAKDVENDRGGSGATHSHEDAALTSVLGEIVDDENVVGEASLPDHLELVVKPAPRVVSFARIPAGETFEAEARKMFVGA